MFSIFIAATLASPVIKPLPLKAMLVEFERRNPGFIDGLRQSEIDAAELGEFDPDWEASGMSREDVIEAEGLDLDDSAVVRVGGPSESVFVFNQRGIELEGFDYSYVARKPSGAADGWRYMQYEDGIVISFGLQSDRRGVNECGTYDSAWIHADRPIEEWDQESRDSAIVMAYLSLVETVPYCGQLRALGDGLYRDFYYDDEGRAYRFNESDYSTFRVEPRDEAAARFRTSD
ncbi:hypothetical protein [Sphingomicrobium sediminis]|uniref:Uncharacterized protein n=1 Tax=Sphingomicrobium sediminis TaxID=2950949 RepID=A0A9X2J1T3_9SPHN|nr:hypothetical protein [Sphingomicrobium sediminis]MCM8557588.1 hypothetical protein [Sphingomicrobium sediminis]